MAASLYTKRLLSPWDAYILHKQVIVCGAETRRPRRHSTLKTKIIYPCYSKWRRIAFIRATIANKTDVVGSDGVVPYNNVYITVITILPAGAIDREFFFFTSIENIRFEFDRWWKKIKSSGERGARLPSLWICCLCQHSGDVERQETVCVLGSVVDTPQPPMLECYFPFFSFWWFFCCCC